MEQLTGKARIDFIAWYIKTYFVDEPIRFKSLPQSAQFGLIQEWGDSVEIFISINYSRNLTMQGSDWFHVRVDDKYVMNGLSSRQQPQMKAVEKLSEIYNQLKQ